jgi:DNA-binding response OmpR family regulator
MKDILIIEDSKDLAILLRDFLSKEGFLVEVAYTGEAGLAYIKKEGVKIVLLDIMLPGMDGFAVCKLIREEFNVPLFIMSAKTNKEDKMNGLLLGADDYIEKPYDMDVLIAKVKAVYRRYYDKFNSQQLIFFGNLVMDVTGHKVSIAGNELSVTVKEFELLKLLMENEGKVLKKEWIFDQVWGVDSFSEPSTLTVHIKWLRLKIEADPKNPIHIQTVWGVGYKFVGEAR